MKCMKCNHLLPDDSEFCQYCGTRIEKSEMIPELDATIVADEVTAASDVPVKNEIEALAGGETPKQSAEEGILPLPEFENMEPEEAPKPIRGIDAHETIGPRNANRQSQPGQEGEMGFGLVPEKARKAKKVKQPKKKYCSRCGELIDQQSKQCTGCGKKYFKGIKFNPIVVTITVLSLVIAALGGFNILQYLNNSSINEELHKNSDELRKSNVRVENLEVENENLEKENKELAEKASELRTELHNQRMTLIQNDQVIERLRAEISEDAPLIRFCKDYVEIIGDDGTNYYHKYGCKYLNLSNGFLVLNTEAAKVRGFTECPYCRYTQS